MRTTLTIDDSIAQSLKDISHKTGKSFKRVVNDTLRAGLVADKIMHDAKPYRVKPVSMGEPALGYDLDKALEIAEHLEDEEIVRKLGQRK